MDNQQNGQQGMTLGEFLGGAFVAALTAYAGYKLYQAATDEEYDQRTLPRHVRLRLLAEHVDAEGEWCPGHGREGHFVEVEDLTVDHIIAHSKGGRTSVHNSQILCRSCNSNKGATVSITDSLRGR